jgi:anti-sigma factor RsiW
MTAPDLTCAELVELVTDYLEDALSASDRTRFEEHLGECEGCVGYVAQITTTIALTGRLTEASLPADVRDELLARFRDWKLSA